MAVSVSCTSSTTTSLIFEASGISSDNVSRRLYVRLDDGTSDTGSSTTGTPWVRISGLTPGTRYEYAWEVDYYTAGQWNNGASGTGVAWTDEESGGGGGGSGGSDEDYHWDCYNLTAGDYMGYETSTSSSSITAPTISGYTYQGYVYHSTWSECVKQAKNGNYDGTDSVCTNHSSRHPYVVFFYTEAPTGWYLQNLGNYSGTVNTYVDYNLSSYGIGYIDYTPNSNGLLTAYASGDSFDDYGFIGYANSMGLNSSASSGYQAITNYLISDDQSGGNGHFKITQFSVTANTTYRIAIAPWSNPAAFSGKLYFYFESISSWMTPINMYTIGSGTSGTSGTTSVPAYKAGYITVTTPSYAGKLVFKTTSNSKSPDYYSYLSSSPLSAASGTSRTSAVSGTTLKVDDDGAGTGYDTKIEYTASASTTYYWYVNAAWSNSSTYSIPWQYNYYRQYTITFNKNDGTNTIWSTNYIYADSMSATMAPAPSRTNYTFQGWSTSSSATSGYSAGSSVSVSGSTTFYAIWKRNTITVTYNANGGSGGPGSQTVNTNSSFNINGSNYPIRNNYIFKGWSTSSSAKTATYKKGATPSISTGTSNITYYAVWWPAFTWKDYSRSEANTFAGYINTYLNSSITTINDTNPLRLVVWFNAITTALGNNIKVASGDASFKTQLDTLLTAYNNY